MTSYSSHKRSFDWYSPLGCKQVITQVHLYDIFIINTYPPLSPQTLLITKIYSYWVITITYNMGNWDLPDIYALAQAWAHISGKSLLPMLYYIYYIYQHLYNYLSTHSVVLLSATIVKFLDTFSELLVRL